MRTARAKVNLFLHAGTRRADGYHALVSWVVFAELGDSLSVTPAPDISLTVQGAFAAGVPAGADNLVWRAALALQSASGISKGAALALTKSLPAAAGLGGGSSDAAAALLALHELWGLDLDPQTVFALGMDLGSDVGACLYARSVMMRGRGEDIADGPLHPPLPCVLVNPGVAVPTKDVFEALSQRSGAMAPPMPEQFSSPQQVAGFLARTKNDLELPALKRAPVIAQALSALNAQPGILLARMSGSGATCFGLFADDAAAQTAALSIKGAQAGWWVAATRLSEPQA